MSNVIPLSGDFKPAVELGSITWKGAETYTSPLIAAWRCADGVHLVFFCPECQRWHYHGAGGDRPGDGDGHRAAHCHRTCLEDERVSKFKTGGYYLKEVGRLTREVRDAFPCRHRGRHDTKTPPVALCFPSAAEERAAAKAKAAKVRAALGRIVTLTRQLCKDIDYASAASTQAYWNAYQRRRSAASIARKKAECRRLIQAIPGSAELLALTRQLWQALAAEHRDRADPAPPILARQKAAIAALRSAAR